MHKTFVDSRIEIWGSKYINQKASRNLEDKDAVIIQMERGANDYDYIVELLDKMDDEHKARFL